MVVLRVEVVVGMGGGSIRGAGSGGMGGGSIGGTGSGGNGTW